MDITKKMKTWIVSTLLLLITSTATADQPPGIYSAIELLPFDAHGWFYNEFALDEIFNEREIHTVIELGSWCGASTRFFGHRVGEGGRVYAVDTWKGTSSNRHMMRDRHLPHLYQQFLSNTVHAELTDRIVPIRMTTDDAAKFMSVKADLIYLDADDSADQVYTDIITWYSHLNKGGVMCGNDWSKKSVSEGVTKAAAKLGLTIEVDSRGIFWQLK